MTVYEQVERTAAAIHESAREIIDAPHPAVAGAGLIAHEITAVRLDAVAGMIADQIEAARRAHGAVVARWLADALAPLRAELEAEREALNDG